MRQFCLVFINSLSQRLRHNVRDGILNHQSHDCLRNRLFRCTSKKSSKLRVTGLCAENSLAIGEFPAQMAITAENVSIWWRQHVGLKCNHYKIKQSKDGHPKIFHCLSTGCSISRENMIAPPSEMIYEFEISSHIVKSGIFINTWCKWLVGCVKVAGLNPNETRQCKSWKRNQILFALSCILFADVFPRITFGRRHI